MAETIRALISHENVSGDPKDRSINVMHFRVETGSDVITEAALIATALGTMFKTAMDVWHSNQTPTTGHTVKWYRLSDPKPRQSFLVSNLSAYAVGPASTLPQEVCLCMSFKAAYQSGYRQASQRGRIYFGPYATNANVFAGVPDVNVIDSAKSAGIGFLAASTAAGGWTWVIWSVKHDRSFDVVNGWVDNAWDTQRRRGRVAVTRNPFSV